MPSLLHHDCLDPFVKSLYLPDTDYPYPYAFIQKTPEVLQCKISPGLNSADSLQEHIHLSRCSIMLSYNIWSTNSDLVELFLIRTIFKH